MSAAEARRYNPMQPRDPGGKDGGRWVKVGASVVGLEVAPRRGTSEDTRRKMQREWARESYAATLAEKLTPHERNTLAFYKEDSDVLNGAIRSGEPLSSGHTDNVRTLDAALEKAPLPESTLLFRYMPKRAVPAFEQGDEFELDPAYLSTSTSRDFVEHEAAVETLTSQQPDRHGAEPHVVLDLHVPKGTPSMALDLLNDMQEFEVLLPRKLRGRVTGTKTERNEAGVVELEHIEIEIIP